MQQTEKYQFNLIEGSDPFSPEPLNQNTEKVEGALMAQAADMTARFAALPKIHFQTWTGNGTESRTVTFPFKPRVVILSQAHYSYAGTLAVMYGQEQAQRINGNGTSEILKLTWSENTLSMSKKLSSASDEINFSADGKTYFALAFQ